MKKISLLCLCAGVIGFSACEEVDTSTLEPNQGAFVLNAGSGNSTISYYNFEKEKCENNYFQTNNNGQTLGANAGSMAFVPKPGFPSEKALVAVAGTGSEGHIEVINVATFQATGQINGINQPGDLVVVSDKKAYVTSGNGTADGSDVVIELDLENNKTGKIIKVGKAPSKMVVAGKYLYVANQGTAAAPDNRIMVIDMSREGGISVDTVEVAAAPVDMAVDKYGNIWVYCDGTGSANDQALVKLEKHLTYDEEEIVLEHETYTIPFAERKAHEDNCLTITKYGGELFYVHGTVYRLDVDVELDSAEDIEAALPQEGCVEGTYADKKFRGIDVDAKTGRVHALVEDGANSKLVIYTIGYTYLSEADGANSFTVGENPLEVVYNY